MYRRCWCCVDVLDASPRERKMTAADVTVETRSQLEEMLIEGVVVGADGEMMNTLTKLLLAHDQQRIVRRILRILLYY